MKLNTLLPLIVFLKLPLFTHAGCSPEPTHKLSETTNTLKGRILKTMNHADEIVWGKVDSVKFIKYPKQIFYEVYNNSDPTDVFQLSRMHQSINPYLSDFQNHFVWFSTVKLKGSVYKVQIGKIDSECSHEHLVKAGQDIPFLLTNKGELKEILDFYQYQGYRMVPGAGILGKIGLEVIWPNGPSLDK